jgi:hypothetical protein
MEQIKDLNNRMPQIDQEMYISRGKFENGHFMILLTTSKSKIMSDRQMLTNIRETDPSIRSFKLKAKMNEIKKDLIPYTCWINLKYHPDVAQDMKGIFKDQKVRLFGSVTKFLKKLIL